VPASPPDPGPAPGTSPGPRETQEQILALEMAAFPGDDEPDWAALEALEYPGAGPGGAIPGGAIPGGAIPGDREPGDAIPGDGQPGAGPVGFEQGGPADVLGPGLLLAALAEQAWEDGLGGLGDDELTGVMAAWQRLGARAAAGLLAAAGELASRREAEGNATRDWRPLQHAGDEVAAALTMTRQGAAAVLALAAGLGRLPQTGAALASGRIDERRAWVIADEVSGLDDDHAAAVEGVIIGKAARQTTGQLRPAVRRAVIAADPAAAKRRKEEALKDARVETSTEPSGTARMSGRDLPPADVLAADKYLSALAQAMKQAGTEGTMDQLRARAYLHLLGGGDPATLLTPPPASTAVGDAPGDGAPGSGTPGGGPAGNGETRGPAAGPGRGLAALHGSVHLTMPLLAWLGWSQSPGQVPGFGTTDADDSRALAAMLARDPATKWCLTLTDPAGHPVAHGCARHGPRPPGGESLPSGADPRPDRTPDPGPDPGPDGTPDPGPGPRAGPGPAPPAGTSWLQNLTLSLLHTGTCTHPRETPAYRPSAALRHLIEIRHATCTHPGCRRAATRCDLDHTVPYDQGGRTCTCNMGPRCRHHHQAKQAPGWTLTQTHPGIMTLTTRNGRTYTTHPTTYPD
jgi:hypothetical protein